jgi:hypothetical protein
MREGIEHACDRIAQRIRGKRYEKAGAGEQRRDTSSPWAHWRRSMRATTRSATSS